MLARRRYAIARHRQQVANRSMAGIAGTLRRPRTVGLLCVLAALLVGAGTIALAATPRPSRPQPTAVAAVDDARELARVRADRDLQRSPVPSPSPSAVSSPSPEAGNSQPSEPVSLMSIES